MQQLPVVVRIRIVLFVSLAFSTYYFQYFQSFSQGVVEERSIAIYVTKVFSMLFFILAFFSSRVKFNYFDFQFLIFTFGAATSYLIAGILCGFNDILFLNFLIFSFCYPFLIYENVEKKIYFSYEIICVVIFIQTIGDVLLSVLGVMLWDGGLYIGGLGNPTSFAFVTVFCLTYITFGKTSFSNTYKVLLGIIYIFSVIMTKALFPILLALAILLVAIVKIESKKRKIFFICSVFFAVVLFITLIDFKGGLLSNKLNSLLYYVGLSDIHKESRSVSLRVENINMAIDFLRELGLQWGFGHYQGLTYYPVDSQYISILLSFGFFLFFYFLVFNFTALLRILNKTRIDNRAFIFFGFLLCNFMFVNNRILDYFPLGFIYISLIALISRIRTRHI